MESNVATGLRLAKSITHGGKRMAGMDEPFAKKSRMDAPVEQMAHSSTTGTGVGGVPASGEAAIPTKSSLADGTVDSTVHISYANKSEFQTFTFSGMTWLNNTRNIAAPTQDANQWLSFPWEFPSLWLSDLDKTRLINEYQRWKPKSVTFSLSDAQNFSIITSAGSTTPITIPTGNGKIYAFEDHEYLLGVSNALWGIGDNGTDIVPFTTASASSTFVQNQIQSYRQSGYNADVQVFLPNNYNFGASASSLNATNYLGVNTPGTRSIAMGSGHSMTFTHHFENLYWRSTSELGVNCNRAVALNVAASLNVPALPRADEVMGYLRTPSTADGNNGLIGFTAYGQPTNIQVKDAGIVNANYTPYNNNAAFTSQNVIPTDHVFRSWKDPQPRLMIHLQPDIGVAGSVGSSQCQVNFKISYTFELKGRMPPAIVPSFNIIGAAPTQQVLANNAVFKNPIGPGAPILYPIVWVGSDITS